jgi:hypothetical protein
MALMKAVEEVQKLLTQEKAKNDALSRDFKDTGSLNIVAKLLSSLCANARVAASLPTCVEFNYTRAESDFCSCPRLSCIPQCIADQV